jgi:hypothetical protein
MAVFNRAALNNPPPHLLRHAEAIAAVTEDPHERLLLVATDWGETRFGVSGVAFGATAYARHHRRDRDLLHLATASLRSLQMSASACHVPLGTRATWVFFYSGRCTAPEQIRVRVRIRRHRTRWLLRRNPVQIYANEMLGRVRRLESEAL